MREKSAFTVLGIAGSLRAGSYNKALLRIVNLLQALKEWTKRLGVQ